MKLYVARHGQTDWNAENRVCGSTNRPLTEKGKEQADQTAHLPGLIERRRGRRSLVAARAGRGRTAARSPVAGGFLLLCCSHSNLPQIK